MEDLVVSGGKRLVGEIMPSGSKNAALPVIFSSLAIDGISMIENVADIGDVRVAIEILKEFGAAVERRGETLIIDTRNLEYKKPSHALTSKIRASSYLIGACLARFGIFHLSEFGGCNFCNRPIDMHLFAAEALGAEISGGIIKARKLCGNKIEFKKQSVGATINALIMASFAEGETIIEGAAKEPHVRMLADFLISAGANITEDKTHYIVRGSHLSGGKIKVIPDMIEAGTFLLLAPLTDGKITVKNASLLELESFLEPLSDSGIDVRINFSDITVFGVPERPIQIKTAPHPGYPTDLQPLIAPLMAKYLGGTISENVWQNRFSYLDELSAFGVNFCKSNNKAIILPSKLHSANSCAPDLRGGAAAVMCALSAEGESRIKNSEIIFRGYANFEDKLRSLGATVSRNSE